MNYPFVINENDIEETNIGWFREEFKNLNDKGFELKITDILKRNGWEFVEEGDYGATWKKDFCVMYTTTVHAVIGYKPEHIGGAWQYGLQWLECEYEYHDQEHGRRDLEDMYDGMRIALEHLLAKGIPFHPYSDVARQKEYWHLTNQEIKRNIDLINATRLLEFNYEAVKKDFNKNNKDNNFVDFMSKKENLDKNDEWMRDFLKADKEVKKNECKG